MIINTIEKKITPFLPFLEIFAPIYFIIIASLRCYIESHILSEKSFFSYYLLSHHVLWFITSILAVILFLHLYLRKPVTHLFWLFYGGSIIFIPILYSYVFKMTMNLEYFSGTFSEIASYSLTAAYKFTRNRPQFWAIIILDIGIFITGYIYTKSFKRALITLFGTHFILTIIGTKWFGKSLNTTAVFRVNTSFSGQEYMSLIWLQTSTFLSLMLLFRGIRDLIDIKKIAKIILISAAGWGIYTTVIYKLGIFRKIFDAATTGILVFTIILSILLFLNSKGSNISKWVYAVLLLIVSLQIYVVVPVLL